MSIWLSTLMSAALLAQPAAEAPAKDAAPTTVEGVVITAGPKPEREVIASFVAAISSEGATNRLGRWDRKICPGLLGVREDYARLILDRIGETAQEVGLDVGEPGCRANMLVVFTANSGAVTKAMVEGNSDVFGKYDQGVNRGRKALKAFVLSQAPVRWWHVSARKTADGQRYDVGGMVRVRDVGRLKATTRDDFDHVILVVDASRVGKVRMTALADYIAMVGLAQIDTEAETGEVQSILNLFSDRDAGRAPVDGLTTWDRAYLKGLYEARRDVRTAARQEQDMVRSMAADLKAPPAEPKKEE